MVGLTWMRGKSDRVREEVTMLDMMMGWEKGDGDKFAPCTYDTLKTS